MTEEIIIAGFGGQGVLSMGKILAYSGIMQDQEVSWMPSYGPEMRGGTANVTVIISDERISSPVLNAFDSAIVLNQQSMDKFEPLVKAGGTLIYDPNGITHHPTRKDINIYQIEGARLAAEAVPVWDPLRTAYSCRNVSVPCSTGTPPPVRGRREGASPQASSEYQRDTEQK